MNTDWVQLVFACVVAVATVVYVVETIRMRRAQTEPVILVRAESFSTDSTDICLSIENTGTSTAYDVSFEVDDQAKIALSTPNGSRADNFLVGSSAIAPREKISYIWGRFGEVYAFLEEKPIDVRVQYFVSPKRVRRFRRVRESRIVVSKFDAESLISPPGNLREMKVAAERITSALTRIEKSINKIAFQNSKKD